MIFDQDSSSAALKLLIDQRMKLRPGLSLRAVARDIGVSPATLSECLSGKKILSPETAFKVAHWARLTKKEERFFLLITRRDAAKSSELKNSLQAELISLQEGAQIAEERKIAELLARTEVARSYFYREKESYSLRVLELLRDKESQQMVPEFLDHFVAPTRKVSGSAYFFRNPNGSYYNLVDFYFEGEAGVNRIVADDKSLRVEFDSEGLPQIYGASIHVGKSSRKVFCDLIFTPEKFVLQGIEVDDEDKSYRREMLRTYLRGSS